MCRVERSVDVTVFRASLSNHRFVGSLFKKEGMLQRRVAFSGLPWRMLHGLSHGLSSTGRSMVNLATLSQSDLKSFAIYHDAYAVA